MKTVCLVAGYSHAEYVDCMHIPVIKSSLRFMGRAQFDDIVLMDTSMACHWRFLNINSCSLNTGIHSNKHEIILKKLGLQGLIPLNVYFYMD